MPQLPNIRHEKFAREYRRTGVSCTSYLVAGYKPTTRSALDASAYQLLRRPQIQRRLKELRQEMARRQDITVDSLLQDVLEDRALARRLGQPSTAIAATQLAARLCGLLVERKETGQPGEFASLQTPDEVLALVEKELGTETAALLRQALERAEPEPTPEPRPNAADDAVIVLPRAPGEALN